MKIAIIAFDDFTDLDLILHWDLLNRVNYIGGIKDWTVKILGTKASHLSALGLPIPTSGMIEEASDADGIIICSGKGTRPLLADEAYLKRLRLDPNRQIIGAQCSGSLILGALGFLSDVPVSAYTPIIKELEKYNVKLIDEALVIHKNVATASSCLAGQYLSRWMIETLAGEEIARKVMRTVEPLGHHRPPRS